jgi:hypothetical protein
MGTFGFMYYFVIVRLCLTPFRTLAINNDDKSNLFVLVFIIFWLGGLIITLNAKLLDAHMYKIF